MIPHRMLASEIYGTGLRDRVTACRRRLRVNRVAYKDRGSNDAGELFLETVMPATVVRMNCIDSLAVTQPEDSETMQTVEEQEVGIT